MTNKTIYEELCAWLEKVSGVSGITPATYSDTEWIVGTGDIIGAYQETDLKIADELAKRSQSGLLDDDDTVEKLLQSPANALAMLSSMAMVKVGYNPKEVSDVMNVERYKKYRSLMAENPLLTLAADENRQIKYQENNYKSLADNVISLFDDLSVYDEKKLKASANILLKILTSQGSVHVSSVNFTQDIIVSESKEMLYINMNTSYMEFTKKGIDGTKCTSEPEYKSKIDVDYFLLKFNPAIFDKKMAKSILDVAKSNLKDWIDKVKTPVI